MTQPTESEEILERLNAFLMSDKLSENSMLLSDLDGFLTGIAIGPELIMPSKWLPLVWGEESPAFDDLDEANAIVGAIMFRYNEILAEIERGEPNPIYWTTKDGVTLTGDWAEGFMQAVDINPAAWDKLFKAKHMAPYFLPILALCFDEDGDPLVEMPDDVRDQVTDFAEDAIPMCVNEIAAFWRKKSGPGARRDNKVGRNDPCPCGSGKKFKKCCGSDS
jgi:uncharacterized protein